MQFSNPKSFLSKYGQSVQYDTIVKVTRSTLRGNAKALLLYFLTQEEGELLSLWEMKDLMGFGGVALNSAIRELKELDLISVFNAETNDGDWFYNAIVITDPVTWKLPAVQINAKRDHRLVEKSK